MVYREVTEEYWAPLGVWVIREGMRAAMREPPERHVDIGSALRAIGSRVRIPGWYGSAALLGEIRSQRRLDDFA